MSSDYYNGQAGEYILHPTDHVRVPADYLNDYDAARLGGMTIAQALASLPPPPGMTGNSNALPSWQTQVEDLVNAIVGENAVTSVAGRTGAVTLSNTDISGLGTAATKSTGTSAGNVVVLDGSARLPAVDGSQLTNMPSGAVTSVAGRTGAVALSNTDISGLGTASALDVAATGDATSGQVVKGSDSRLSDARTPTSHQHPASAISDSTSVGRSVLTAIDAAAARTAIGAGTGSGDVAGPSSSTDNTLPRFDGTTGKTLQSSGVVVSDANEISGFLAGINFQTGTTYTIAASDAGKLIDHANGSAIAVTLPNSLAVGFSCSYVQTGAGQITFSAASGATLRHADSHTKAAKQYAPVQLYVRSNSGGTAAEWVLTGYTAA